MTQGRQYSTRRVGRLAQVVALAAVLAACGPASDGDDQAAKPAARRDPTASGPGDERSYEVIEGGGKGCSVTVSGGLGEASWSVLPGGALSGVTIDHDGDTTVLDDAPGKKGPLPVVSCTSQDATLASVDLRFVPRTRTEHVPMGPGSYDITADRLFGDPGTVSADVSLGPSSRVATGTLDVRKHVRVGTLTITDWTKDHIAGSAELAIMERDDPSVTGSLRLTFDYAGPAIEESGR
jgi:hypothetical protein